MGFENFHNVSTPTAAVFKFIGMMPLNMEMGRDMNSHLPQTDASQTEHITGCGYLIIFSIFSNAQAVCPL